MRLIFSFYDVCISFICCIFLESFNCFPKESDVFEEFLKETNFYNFSDTPSFISIIDGFSDEILKVPFRQNAEVQKVEFRVFSMDFKTKRNEKYLMEDVFEASKNTPAKTVVTVTSISTNFLSNFANVSSKFGILSSTSVLFVFSSLEDVTLRELMASSWLFSMMNSIFFNRRTDKLGSAKWDIWKYSMFTPLGPKAIKCAFLRSSDTKLKQKTNKGTKFCNITKAFLPKDYNNFYGAKIPVTAKSYPPYWIEINKTGEEFYGIDYLMIVNMAQKLNFSFHVLESKTWKDVTDAIVSHNSYMGCVIHAVLPDRLKRFDFSTPFEMAQLSFALISNVKIHRSKSVFSPFGKEVWFGVLGTLIFLSFCFTVQKHREIWTTNRSKPMSVSTLSRKNSQVENQFLKSFEKTFAILLGQSVLHTLHVKRSAVRILLMFWIFFSLVLSMWYQSNMTAIFALPFQPIRINTIRQLANSPALIVMPSYGESFTNFFLTSSSEDFRKLGMKSEILQNDQDLLDELKRGNAIVDTKRFLQLLIRQSTSQSHFYIGRESLSYGWSALPLPHDAPYAPSVNRIIRLFIESGLYKKWSDDVLMFASKKVNEKEKKDSGIISSASDQQTATSLKMEQLEGVFFLYIIGMAVSFSYFILELLMPTLISKLLQKPKSNYC